MDEILLDQLSARERKIIRQSFNPDAKFYNKSPQSSPRNHYKTSNINLTQNSLPKIANDEKALTQSNEKEEKNENSTNEDENLNTETSNDTIKENNQENKEINSVATEQEESNENPQNIEENSENKDITENDNEVTLKIESDDDILARKLNEISMKHSIQQKILVQQAEIQLKKSNYSPVSLRSFIIKTNNFKQKRQDEMMQIYSKYGSTLKIEKQITQKPRSKSEKPKNNQTNYNNSHRLNLTPRLSMFASKDRIIRPNPRFSTPAPQNDEKNETNYTERIKLPPMSQSQQFTNHLPLFDTQSEKVYHSENSLRSNSNDPFSIFLSHQELVPSPNVKLNVKPPPPPPKNASSPRKQSKKKGKTSRLSKMSRKKGASAMSNISQEPQEPPPPPIKRHILTMRASMIPKSGVIDVDKRDFLDFLNEREEEIEVEVKVEEPAEDESQGKAKSKSRSKSRAKTKSSASSKKSKH